MQFKSYAYGLNHWRIEPDLKAILRRYLPQNDIPAKAFERFGDLAGGRAYAIADYVDHKANPELIAHAVNGRRIDRALLSPAHADLLRDLAFINRPPYEGRSWHEHFTYGFLLADPGLYCSLIVTNQTAYAIHKYAHELGHFLPKLLNGEMWGATWMTETHGGSDLGANLTSAKPDGEAWRLSGEHKYFASNAGLADLAVVTARPEAASPGPKGLALFLVPRLNPQGELNFHVRRLKSKSATRAVPTGEVEFNHSLAYKVGKPELGIYYTLENLTVSRLANAVGAMGLSRKAQIESVLRAGARQAFGSEIIQHPLMRRDLSELTLRITAGLALVFHAIDAFDRAWHETPPYNQEYHYARMLSHLAKNRTAEHAAASTLLAMEIFGGLGFLEEYPVARLHREALVTAIWEGSSNIQALELLEVMYKKSAHESFLTEFIPSLEAAATPHGERAKEQIISAANSLMSAASPAQSQWIAKDALRTLADGAQVALLYRLADSAGEIYAKLAELYVQRFIDHEPLPDWVLHEKALWQPFEGLYEVVVAKGG